MRTEVTINEAINILGVSEQRVRTLCHEGNLDARTIGRSWLITTASIAQRQQQYKKFAEDKPSYIVKASKPIALSFFSGALGLDLGLEKAGFDVRLACEVDCHSR